MSENPVKTQLSKTLLCNFYASGLCTKGARCKYAHSDQELCAAPDLTKTSLCKAWKSGMCKLEASKCTFAHGVKELRITPHFLARNRLLQERRMPPTTPTHRMPSPPARARHPSPKAASTATGIMTMDSGSDFFVNPQGSTGTVYSAVSTMSLESSLLFLPSASGILALASENPSSIIHEVATTVSDEGKVSLAYLSYMLQLMAAGRMNEDHALAQVLINAMPTLYED